MAKYAQHAGQIVFHRADILAGTAQGFAFAEVGVGVDSLQEGGDHCTDGPAIG